MTAVAAHKGRGEQPHPPERPADNRHLEQQAHQQEHRPQRGHIRLQRNLVGDIGADLVRAEKPERKRKDDTIAQHHAHHKQQIPTAHKAIDVVFLALVECGRHEA